MAKTTFQWVRDDEEPVHLAPYRPSRRQKRAPAVQADAIVEALLVAPQSLLATVPLPDDAREALAAIRKVKPSAHGAKRRLILGLASVLREADQDALALALGITEGGDGNTAFQAQLDAAERWRDQLLAGGDEVVTALFDAHADADRQRLRQLVANARKDEAAAKRGKAYKQLFAALRELMAASAPEPQVDAGDDEPEL